MIPEIETVEAPTAGWEPKILALVCSWCGYTGADEAGMGGIQYPANARIVQVSCSCRINPMLILKALQRGIDGVLVVGCPPGRCHYTQGNYYARRRLALLKSLLAYVGVEPERIKITWVGAAEGARFARAMTEAAESVKRVGPPEALVKRRKGLKRDTAAI